MVHTLSKKIAEDQQSIESGRSESKFKTNLHSQQSPYGVKDKLPRKDRAGVVYAIPCGRGAKYVGEIGRTLGHRIAEHRKAFECNYPNRSAIAKHGLPLPNSTHTFRG